MDGVRTATDRARDPRVIVDIHRGMSTAEIAAALVAGDGGNLNHLRRPTIYTRPEKLPEANIQAELYLRLRNAGFECQLEYFHAGWRIDCAVLDPRNPRLILCLIEVKNHRLTKADKSQIAGYKSIGVPVLVVEGLGDIDTVVDRIAKSVDARPMSIQGQVPKPNAILEDAYVDAVELHYAGHPAVRAIVAELRRCRNELGKPIKFRDWVRNRDLAFVERYLKTELKN